MREVLIMVKKKLGITLSEPTLENLEKMRKMNGLTKSQAIALLINTYVNEKMGTEKNTWEGEGEF